MIRRSVLAVCALVGAVSLSSCSTFSDNDAVARVGDVELSRETLEEFINDFLSTRGDVPDQIAGDAYRQVIGGWVFEELIRQKLASDGIEASDDDRAAADEAVSADLQGLEAEPSDAVRQFIFNSYLARTVFQRTQQDGALGEFANATSVVVDPRYGYWDSSSGTVLPLQA